LENAVTVAGQTYSSEVKKLPSEDLAGKRRRFMAYETNKQKEMDEGQEARRYYHGKQWTDDEITKLGKRGQPVVTDNRIARKVDFLVGIEQRMRRDPKGYARTPQHDQQADLSSSGIRYVCDSNRWENIASNSSHDGMVSGFGVAWIGIEPRRGQLDCMIKHVDCDRFFYDTRSTKPDFSDARYMGVHLWMDIEEAIEAWPDQEDTLRAAMNSDGGLTAFKAEEDRSTQWSDFEHSRVRVVEFWEKKRDGWHYCKFTGDIYLEGGVSPYIDEFGMPDTPYRAWSPYIDEKGVRYGLVRNMKSMQDEINHRRSRFLYLLNSQKVFVRRGSVDDIDEFKREVAKPNAVIEHDGEWGKDTGFVDSSKELSGQAELLAQAQSALENLGPNPGLVGKGGGVADQSGRAILAQRDSGMTELSPVFERLRDWKLRCYRAVWNRIKQSWTGERWIRVTDDPRSAQFIGVNQYEQDPETGEVRLSNNIAELDVDIILEEGPDTITMSEELLQRLAEIAQAPPQMWSILIELSNVPNKERLLEMVNQAMAPPPVEPPQPDPMQEKAIMLDLADKAASVESKKASTAKTYSDIGNNRAEAAAKLIQAETARRQPTEIGNYYQQ
jgi:hypothetical protein